mmetsp:Transcript_24645/g.32157  ORF Transcript_24645/g.32157 Transcript_24645/m.32157 type:complete len:923 (+) Transcript_24645:201-2969(+)
MVTARMESEAVTFKDAFRATIESGAFENMVRTRTVGMERGAMNAVGVESGAFRELVRMTVCSDAVKAVIESGAIHGSVSINTNTNIDSSTLVAIVSVLAVSGSFAHMTCSTSTLLLLMVFGLSAYLIYSSEMKQKERREKEREREEMETAMAAEQERGKIESLDQTRNEYSKFVEAKASYEQKVFEVESNLQNLVHVDTEGFLNEFSVIKAKADKIAADSQNSYSIVQQQMHQLADKADRFIKYFMFQESINSAVGEINRAKQSVDGLSSKYKLSTNSICARRIKEEACKVETINGLDIYKLPTRKTYQHEDYKNIEKRVRVIECGSPDENNPTPVKHVLLMGMTGAGKSLHVNNMVNYLTGVDFTDDFRFKLIFDEDEFSERHTGDGEVDTCTGQSMTSWVTVYILHWRKGFRTANTVAIVDTPGFGDTRGSGFDEIIVKTLNTYFNDSTANPTKSLACIGYLMQSSQARLTLEQKFISDQVLGMLGKDTTPNVAMNFTFADGQDPPALQTARAAEIPFTEYFKFNNSALYADHHNKGTEFSWEFGYESLKNFFLFFDGVQEVSLTLTCQVLRERETLKDALTFLRRATNDGIERLTNIEVEADAIINLQGTIEANANYERTVEIPTRKEEPIKPGAHVTNCINCNVTCHEICYIAGNQKEGCWAMGSNGKCRICPERCPFSVHRDDRVRIVTVLEHKMETINDMLQRYNVGKNEKNKKKVLLNNMLLEYKDLKKDVYEKIKISAEVHSKLATLCIKPTFLSSVDYIKRLIEEERKSSRPGKIDRINALQNLLGMAEMLQKAKKFVNNQIKPTDFVSEFENTVRKKIRQIPDEVDQTLFSNEDSTNAWEYKGEDSTNASSVTQTLLLTNGSEYKGKDSKYASSVKQTLLLTNGCEYEGKDSKYALSVTQKGSSMPPGCLLS